MYRGGIVLKTPEQLDAMAVAGQVHARCLKMLRAKARPGVTTAELDEAAERFIASQGAAPTFKGYRGFPGSICASVNAMVVHGIPDAYALQRGDVLSIDVGVTKDGWVADGAVTLPIGEVSETAASLLATTEEALHAAVEQMRPGGRLSDVSHAVQSTVEGGGFEVIRSLVGHGIGRDMHEDPQVPNFGPPGRGPELEPGMVLAIEPMTAVGTHEIVQGDDGWAVYSADDSLTAHFEFTVAVTEEGPRILTPWHL
jgi:methionyl aminopeptidase